MGRLNATHVANILKGRNGCIVVIWVKVVLNEITVEICSKSLVRAIGKVLRMELS